MQTISITSPFVVKASVETAPRRVAGARMTFEAPVRAWRRRLPGRIGLAMMAPLLALAFAAAAEDRRSSGIAEPIEFHIPAQPLANALQAYGRRAGIQVLYESRSSAGRRSVAVEGIFAPSAALDVMLTGTGLSVRYIRPDSIIISRVATPDDAVAPSAAAPGGADLSLGTLRVRETDQSDNARFRDYSASVEADIQNALRRNPKTRDGAYRLVLKLWINSSRTVERTELFRSTGDRERDAAVETALRGMTISQSAPERTPQPVRVAIVVTSAQ